LAFLRRYDPNRGRSVTSWLRLLAQRNTIDQLRARAGRQRRREHSTEMDEAFADEETPHRRLELLEQAQLARAAVARLKRVDQQFLNRYLEESQVVHLANSLGCSVGAIHSRQFKIRNKLRHLIHVEQQRAALRQSAYAYARRSTNEVDEADEADEAVG
jgi:RNA polymerase sigma factor (sigma-70 family)